MNATLKLVDFDVERGGQVNTKTRFKNRTRGTLRIGSKPLATEACLPGPPATVRFGSKLLAREGCLPPGHSPP